MNPTEYFHPQDGDRWRTYHEGTGEIISSYNGIFRMRMDDGRNLTFSRVMLDKKVSSDAPKLTDAQLLEAIQAKIDTAQAEADKWKRVRKAWIGV